MPRRGTLLVNEEMYHVYNQSVGGELIFKLEVDRWRFLEVLNFYRFFKIPLRYSYYQKLSKTRKNEFLESLYLAKTKVEILGFALMTNHYHLLVKQKEEKGVSDFIRLVENSFARYFNLKTNRQGAVFQNPFKAKRIASEDEALHVLRYIHLNPVTAYLIKKPERLVNYSWTSFVDYLSNKPRKFVNREFVENIFKNKNKFRKFCLDRAEYQRKLGNIRHLIEK